MKYAIESWNETRSETSKYEPYWGGPIDGPENGERPAMWQVECEIPSESAFAKKWKVHLTVTASDYFIKFEPNFWAQ